MDKVYAGARLRRLREERALTQVEMARMLSLSPSYLNQLEHDSRPLTATVLVALAEVFGIDPTYFAASDTARLIAELREALPEISAGRALPIGDLQHIATSMPEVSQAVASLHRRCRDAVTLLEAVTDSRGEMPALMPHEHVRDFFYRHQNYIDVLDRAAEAAASHVGTRRGEVRRRLRTHLEKAHGVRVLQSKAADAAYASVYSTEESTLTLAADLRPGQQAFRMATQLAYLEASSEIDAVLADQEWPDDATRDLARIGLAHHFAGAFVLPYGPFYKAAERMKYDVELLADYFGVGFETIAHRLSTLQRPGMRGVPFIFVRLDRAGNISKRQSATGFHFSRSGGTCPLWNAYEAFSAPGRMSVQIAEMPDGQRFLWMARTVVRRRGGYGNPATTFVIGLGCELVQAGRLIYSQGLDLARPDPMPIGPGCRTCDRLACTQRAAPRIGRRLEVDHEQSGFAPYAVQAT